MKIRELERGPDFGIELSPTELEIIKGGIEHIEQLSQDVLRDGTKLDTYELLSRIACTWTGEWTDTIDKCQPGSMGDNQYTFRVYPNTVVRLMKDKDSGNYSIGCNVEKYFQFEILIEAGHAWANASGVDEMQTAAAGMMQEIMQ